MQSEKSAGGGGTKINPQEFADKIRALPVRGGVDHEWHVFYDETKPASLYGGTWEELEKGVFLRAAGSGGTPGQKGGSDSHTMTIPEIPMHSHGLYATDPTFGETTYMDPRSILFHVNEGKNGQAIWSPSNIAKTAILENSTTFVGSGTPFSIIPTNISVHIWRKTA